MASPNRNERTRLWVTIGAVLFANAAVWTFTFKIHQAAGDLERDLSTLDTDLELVTANS